MSKISAYNSHGTLCKESYPPSGIGDQNLNHLAFDFVRIWWKLFQKYVMRINFDSYAFI